jgi:hypothetical protein
MKVIKQKANPAVTEQDFQFNPSFGPYIRFLKTRMENSTDIRAKFYRYIIKKFQQQPDLCVPFTDVTSLEQHDDLVQLLIMSLIPLATNQDSVPMALAFMQPGCLFYYSKSFKQSIIDERIEFNTEEDEVSNLRYFMKLVLERCYNVKTDDKRKIIKPINNRKGQTIKHLQIHFESSFIEVHTNGKLPELQQDWLKILNLNDEEFLENFGKFPSRNFTAEGFCMFTVEDVSNEMALNQLRNAILNMHVTDFNETLNLAETAIGELLGDSRIKIGITPFYRINGRIIYDKSLNKNAGVSFVDKRIKNGISIEEIYQKFEVDPKPNIYSNINKEFINSRTSLNDLANTEIKNYMVYPITSKKDGLLGVFELEKKNITTKTIEVLQPAISLICDLFYYMIEMFNYKITRIVKEKFTPLQESVEWKFNEVAWQYLRHDNNKRTEEIIANVIFEQVHPLYGAIDIRNSSVERNIATKNDYLNQLTATLELLEKTCKNVRLPLLESIKFKCSRFISSIGEELTNEDELKITGFFKNEVFLFFKYLSNLFPEFSKDFKDYFEKTNEDSGDFHKNGNEYETTIRKINQNILAYLENEVKILQNIYPFYFEKYRTDGVEYNIYIGQSIIPNNPFDAIYLKNLRLWQLTSMATIAQTNYRMKATLPIPLSTTQLILVNGYPIDISFRKDERRFDLEGSHNIRYEILKKRIDKATIKATGERLTQPDKIAIVYTNSLEVEEYIQHINFLRSKEVLTDNLEMLELENLQGLSGLKALRVGINYDGESLGKDSLLV